MKYLYLLSVLLILLVFYGNGQPVSVTIDTVEIHRVKYATFSRIFSAELTAPGFSTNDTIEYKWFFGDSVKKMQVRDTIASISHKYMASGTYNAYLKVTTRNGHTDSVAFQVIVSDSCNQPAVNVFTPNGDGINDQFIITTNGLNKFKFIFFNRWGNIVFRMDTPQETIVWDGRTADGRLVSPGIYFYVISPAESYTPPDAETMKGFVYIFY